MEYYKRTQSLPCGIPYTIVFSPNRKTLAVEVKSSGEVIVRAPVYVPVIAVCRFAESKTEWIKQAREKVLAQTRELAAAVPPPFTGGDGEQLLYLGEILSVKRLPGETSPRVEQGHLVLPADYGLPEIVGWLRERAADELNSRLVKYGGLLGVSWRSVRLSEARTRWGMCSGKNSVNLSWRLIFCTPEAIDYVVAHELCHIKHKNHGKKFYAELERVFPERKRAERWLKEHSMLIKYL